MKYISVFSGVGGFDLGLDRAGWECVLQIEKDENCQKILARHWPNVTKRKDVRRVSDKELAAYAGTVDLVCGGSPCTDLSAAGRRKGLAGAERVAWRVLDSRYFGVPQRRRRVFVVGYSGAAGASAFEVLFGKDSGAWNFASDGGARKNFAARVAGNAGMDGGARPTNNVSPISPTVTAKWSKGSGGPSGDETQNVVIQKIAEAQQDETRALSAFSLRHAGETSVFGAGAQEEIAPAIGGNPTRTIVAKWGGADQSPVSTSGQAQEGSNYTPVAFQARRFTRDNKTGGAPSKEVDLTNAHKGDDSQSLILFTQEITPKIDNELAFTLDGSVLRRQSIAFTEHKRADGRNVEASDEVMFALTSPRYGGQTVSRHVAQIADKERYCVRRLTPVECERLQGFPDNWTDHLSNIHRYRQMGNAVTVNVAQWLGQRIRAVHEENEREKRDVEKTPSQSSGSRPARQRKKRG